MKASIFMSTYNKNDVLPNVLYSIARQKTDIPFEVCIVDDCSDVSPVPIIKEFLPEARILENDKNFGPFIISGWCLDMIADDSDIIIMQSADVIWSQDTILQELCEGVSDKTIALVRVSNASRELAPPDMYKDFEGGVKAVTEGWSTGTQVCRFGEGGRWYFFLGAILRRDFESMKTREPFCDEMLHRMMQSEGLKVNDMSHLRGIHQEHPEYWKECPYMDTCDIHCRVQAHFNGR